jgi:hypothetical protein
VSWSAELTPPVPLPDGGSLLTLHDARDYALKLPKAVAATTPWQTAIETLLLVGSGDGPVDFARIGLMQALYPKTPVYDRSRKDPKWGRQKLARDR